MKARTLSHPTALAAWIALGSAVAQPADRAGHPDAPPAIEARKDNAIPPPTAASEEQRQAPLKRLTFSPQRGFNLQMVDKQEILAEIRNGAGRTIIRGRYQLDKGNWSLRPKNLAPGLYTVLLWTGSRLRALRLNIAESGKGRGNPEWILEKLPEDPPPVASQPASAPSGDTLRGAEKSE